MTTPTPIYETGDQHPATDDALAAGWVRRIQDLMARARADHEGHDPAPAVHVDDVLRTVDTAPHPDTVRIDRLTAVLDQLEDGAAAAPGRDFGRGVAHATRQIREALTYDCRWAR